VCVGYCMQDCGYLEHLDRGDAHQSFAKAISSDGHSYWEEVLLSLHFLLCVYCCKLLSYIVYELLFGNKRLFRLLFGCLCVDGVQGPQPTAGKVLYLSVISLAGSDGTSMSQMCLFAMVKSLQDRMECHRIVC
jgi:hypothetical protein